MPVLLLSPDDVRLTVDPVPGESGHGLCERLRQLEPSRVGAQHIRLLYRGRAIGPSDRVEDVVQNVQDDIIHVFLSEPQPVVVRTRVLHLLKLPSTSCTTAF